MGKYLIPEHVAEEIAPDSTTLHFKRNVFKV